MMLALLIYCYANGIFSSQDLREHQKEQLRLAA